MVVIGADGGLLADSEPTRAGPRNFSSRPELRATLRGRETSGTRHSDTLGETLQYFAVPIVHANTPVGALRVTYPTSFVDARIRRTWLVLAGVGAIILGIVFLVSLRLARQVTKPLDELERAAARLGQGELDTRAPVPESPPEIRALAESFNRTAERLETLVSSQQAFVADASHQLRTPLAALRLRLENLEGELVDVSEATQDDVAGSLAEVARLSRLVDGLLELARAERGAVPAEAIALEPVVAGRVDAWSALAAERGVELEHGARRRISSSALLPVASTRCSTTSWRTRWTSRPVRVPSGSPGGARDEGIELVVRDAGPGMSPEQRARAFDRFWRPTGASRDGGTGLGLAIVMQLVTADGGRVELDEAEGGGLAVRVVLPPG